MTDDIFTPDYVKAHNLTPEQVQALRQDLTKQVVREAAKRADRFKDDVRPKIVEGIKDLLGRNEHLSDSAMNAKMPHLIADVILYHSKIVTVIKSGDMLLYRNGVYVPGVEEFVKGVVEQAISEKTSSRFFHEILTHVEAKKYVEATEFDADPHIINLQNGLYNVDTDEFRDHTPDVLSLSQLPVSFNPDAQISMIDQFIKDVQPDPQERLKLQEFVGYCLWRAYPAQKALLLTGPSGAGRSTYIELVKSLLGMPNISSRSLQALQYDRFAAADLYGKLANLYADLSTQALKDTALFQQLTGRDPIPAQRKFGQPFKFYNHAKMIFSCNNPPPAPKDDKAYYRRLLMCNFPNVFEGTEREDKEIYTKLTTPNEMSGFLNWALEGLYRLRAYRWRFSNEASSDDIRLDYIRKTDPILAWIEDCVKEDPQAPALPAQEIYASLIDYCRLMKLPVPTQTKFFRQIKPLLKITESHPGNRGAQVLCYSGIKIGIASTKTGSGVVSPVLPVNHDLRDHVGNSSTLDHVQPPIPAIRRLPVLPVEDQPTVPDTDQQWVCEKCGAGYPYYVITCSKCKGKVVHREYGKEHPAPSPPPPPPARLLTSSVGDDMQRLKDTIETGLTQSFNDNSGSPLPGRAS